MCKLVTRFRTKKVSTFFRTIQPVIYGLSYYYPQTDAYLMVFDQNESIIYSTYIGGQTHPGYPENEMIYDLNVNGNQLYMVGRTSSDDSTITYPTFDPGSGAYFEPYFLGGSSDAFITMICTDLIDGINEKTEEKQSSGIFIYPNPANNALYIKLTDVEILASLEMLNNNGQIIRQFSKSDITGSGITVNIENIRDGIYLIKANYLNRIESSKFIKQ